MLTIKYIDVYDLKISAINNNPQHAHYGKPFELDPNFVGNRHLEYIIYTLFEKINHCKGAKPFKFPYVFDTDIPINNSYSTEYDDTPIIVTVDLIRREQTNVEIDRDGNFPHPQVIE